MSLLMWECGLKQRNGHKNSGQLQVTPYVGVWIETKSTLSMTYYQKVTPYVGVWIETAIH